MLRAALASRLTFRNLLIVLSISSLFAFYNFWAHRPPPRKNYYAEQSTSSPPKSKPQGPGQSILLPSGAVACIGPRGKRINENLDDQVKFHKIGDNPRPFAGSYEALGLEPLWTTAKERYGPYGYLQGDGSTRKSVNWDKVEWGRLQAECFRENAHRFPEHGRTIFSVSEPRLRLRQPEDSTSSADWLRKENETSGGTKLFPTPEQVVNQRTNRTLLVMRTYDDFLWTEEDKINLRALIAETALQSGGAYTVMLLVNIKEGRFFASNIFGSASAYRSALKKVAIPEEFRSIAVLWDEQLLKSWYPKIEDHSIMFQINQATQLLAIFYPEFEHFWQLEVDIRSLGHHLPLFDTLDRFGKLAPRKQAIERASYLHMPAEQGPYYPDFLQQVNKSLGGGSKLWGPLRIPEITNPVGPVPPSTNAQDDNFEWGVGDPADLIVTSPCSWVFRMRNWPFKEWIQGPFSQQGDTLRIACPPATQRASRTLLLAAHVAQMELGLAVPSEATLPSFAMWHGLKLSFPPLPYFQKDPPLDSRSTAVFFNGGEPGECVRMAQPPPRNAKAAAAVAADVAEWLNKTADDPLTQQWIRNGSDPITVPWKDTPPRSWYQGFACGEAFINQWPRDYWTLGISWWWISSLPRRVLDVWSQGVFADGIALHDAEGEQHAIDDAWRTGRLAEFERLTHKKQWNEQREVTVILRKHDGLWYAPAAWFHPAKTRKQ